MQTVLGSECNMWLVAGLLVLALGLASALLVAVRHRTAEDAPHPLRTRRTR